MGRITPPQTRVPHQTPYVYRLANTIFDDFLAPVRILLFPFKFLLMLTNWFSRIMWELGNEYSKHSFKKCGRGVHIHGPFHVTAPWNLEIGDNVHINTNAFLRAEGGISIGDNTHISRNLVIYSMNHNYSGELLPYDSGQIFKPVRIGRNVWIGMNVLIVPGVEIGDGAIIGMGTVVAHNVPPLSIIGTASQRVLKERDAEHYHRLDQTEQYAGMSGYARKDLQQNEQKEQ
jgi:acetyltransferase-like isoleucine patch superfamily enzyme